MCGEWYSSIYLWRWREKYLHVRCPTFALVDWHSIYLLRLVNPYKRLAENGKLVFQIYPAGADINTSTTRLVRNDGRDFLFIYFLPSVVVNNAESKKDDDRENNIKNRINAHIKFYSFKFFPTKNKMMPRIAAKI